MPGRPHLGGPTDDSLGLTHVRVVHRQALNKAKPRLRDRLGFLYCGKKAARAQVLIVLGRIVFQCIQTFLSIKDCPLKKVAERQISGVEALVTQSVSLSFVPYELHLEGQAASNC